MRVAHAQEIHVRRRIHRAQRAVDIERRDFGNEIKALRQHDLKDVAGCNVFFGALDRFHKALAAGSSVNFQFAFRDCVDFCH